jgi:photosystem II stability/assembly factor-like uncharacterized protein
MPRRLRTAVLGGLMAVVSIGVTWVHVPATALAATTWYTESSSTTNQLASMSCPSTTTCFSAGLFTIVRTTTAGSSWSTVYSGGDNFYGISCPTTSNCVAVGQQGQVLYTSNGGASWLAGSSGTTNSLEAVSCPDAAHCWAVGVLSTAIFSSDGGATWTAQNENAYVLWGLSCPTTTTCYGVGTVIEETSNGGATWTSRPTPAGDLYAVACPSTTTCVAVGNGNFAVVTNDGGATWASVTTPASTSTALEGITCTSTIVCYAVGGDPTSGVIIETNTGGASWFQDVSGTPNFLHGVSCPAAATCWAGGANGTIVTTINGPTFPSDQCTSPTLSVVDGYVGGVYVRLLAQQLDASTTWICVRIDNGTALNDGARVVVRSPSAGVGIPSADNNASACSATPGNAVPGPHPLLSATVGDPNNPPSFSVMLDTYSNSSGAAWLCLVAGSVQERIVITPPLTPGLPAVNVVQDPAGVHSPPPPQGGTYPSSTCQYGLGGTNTQLADLSVGGVPVSAFMWMPSGNVTDVCVRTGGPVGVGGLLSVNTNGFPGVNAQPIVSSDTSACTVQVLSVGSPAPLLVTRTPTGSNPVELCVTSGTTKNAIGLSVTGSPSLPSITWSPDPGTP